ncbi:hypothetical protein BCD48_17530 [Pseudofrankia sp. BMG5.36]|nr:hypothetical protein BCD48_17530 [Pseudofrankia sp. BMG5.36]
MHVQLRKNVIGSQATPPSARLRLTSDKVRQTPRRVRSVPRRQLRRPHPYRTRERFSIESSPHRQLELGEEIAELRRAQRGPYCYRKGVHDDPMLNAERATQVSTPQRAHLPRAHPVGSSLHRVHKQAVGRLIAD